jgi:hypothetical protein
MRRRRTGRQETFSPLRDKTLDNVLRHLFVTEFGYERKVVFAEVMIERIIEMIETFVKPAALLKPGQLLWMAVANDGRKHTYTRMRDTPQVPVVLDLVADEDLAALADSEQFQAVRRRRHTRLLDQALAQGGVLAQGDLAAISLVAQQVISSDIAYVQEAEKRQLPYRGSVQDIGATISHRAEVARLLEAGYLEPEICRMLSPVHDLHSIENYAQTYKNVVKLLEGGFSPSEISGILSIGLRLVHTYIDIVRQYHPETVERNPHLRQHPVCPEPTSPEGHLSQI